VDKIGRQPLIVEGFVPFDRELSTVIVRDATGNVRAYPLVENWHVDGILHRTLAPAADLGEELAERAAEMAAQVLNALDYVGVLAVEWFQEGPRLIANEMAPRVHNSGHWSIDAAETSQFENHLRAVCGLPLGDTAVTRPAAMYNFIGSVPPAADVLAVPGRKVGHVTVCGPADVAALDAQFRRG
jgi:5-(carboxyamino)imidazole ribonucleotide synthase